jgi:hypothetical protein
MMLQQYQFELRDYSHIFLCHKETKISIATGVDHITKQRAPIRVATGERRHLTVATVIGPVCQ